MDNNQLAEAAKILGVSEDSISAMDDEIKKSMTASLRLSLSGTMRTRRQSLKHSTICGRKARYISDLMRLQNQLAFCL